MKVKSSTAAISTPRPKQRESNEDIKAKLAAKFGDKLKLPEKKKVQVEKKVELTGRGIKSSDDKDFGDVKSNDPDAEMTQEKLRTILKMGGFDFNEKERSALRTILK